MAHNILITGGSGYLGGTLLNRLSSADLLPYGNLYALVRNDIQAKSVKQYNAQPLIFDPYDASAVRENVIKHEINVVFFLIDAFESKGQEHFIQALAQVKKDTEKKVHFLHTSGAKMFSSHCGAPLDRTFSDSDPELYNIHKSQRAAIPMMQKPIETNNRVVELADAQGVRSYIFVPCVVYGRGEGFGNHISIQTTAIVRAAQGAKQVFKVDESDPTWPVSHVLDTTTLYITLLRNILENKSIGHGKRGYYLAASGSVAWNDIYAGIAKSLAKRGVISDDSIPLADDAALTKMAQGLDCPKGMVGVPLAGSCMFKASHGRDIGWQPLCPAEHVLSVLDEEVAIILEVST